ncbi:MAG: hypothetical protein ABIP14_02415 [Blastocatellia bacterium]
MKVAGLSIHEFDLDCWKIQAILAPSSNDASNGYTFWRAWNMIATLSDFKSSSNLPDQISGQNCYGYCKTETPKAAFESLSPGGFTAPIVADLRQ